MTSNDCLDRTKKVPQPHDSRKETRNAEAPPALSTTAAMAFPFPSASWGAQAQLPQQQQASLAPDGMSVMPAPALPLVVPQELAQPPISEQPSAEALPSVSMASHPSSQPGDKMWYPTNAPSAPPEQPPELPQGISFTKLLEDHLQ